MLDSQRETIKIQTLITSNLAVNLSPLSPKNPIKPNTPNLLNKTLMSQLPRHKQPQTNIMNPRNNKTHPMAGIDTVKTARGLCQYAFMVEAVQISSACILV